MLAQTCILVSRRKALNLPPLTDLPIPSSRVSVRPLDASIAAHRNHQLLEILMDNAYKLSGRKTLIMAGVWTSVCVMFPALDAQAAGFNVYAVMDASGDPSEIVSRTTLAASSRDASLPPPPTLCFAKCIALGRDPKPQSWQSCTCSWLRTTKPSSKATRGRSKWLAPMRVH